MNLSYTSNFGKIFYGEKFKTILSIMNTSSIYKLTQVEMTVYVAKETNP